MSLKKYWLPLWLLISCGSVEDDPYSLRYFTSEERIFFEAEEMVVIPSVDAIRRGAEIFEHRYAIQKFPSEISFSVSDSSPAILGKFIRLGERGNLVNTPYDSCTRVMHYNLTIFDNLYEGMPEGSCR
jgi:hypothetical protein